MKAVLVIDVEEKDIGRKVNYVSVQGGGLSYIVGTMGEDVRLRPLPQFEEEAVPYQVSETEVDCYQDPYATGWNDCLEAITGETDES